MEGVRRQLRARRYSPHTETAYVYWIRRYIVHHGRRHPADLGAAEVRDFLSYLAVGERVSASTQNQALAALTFLYDGVLGAPIERVDGISPARRSRHVPRVLSQREVRVLLSRLREPARLCASLMYGSGLRISECLSLRVRDVDRDRREIIVRGGKGDKDRRTPLADSVLPFLEEWLELGMKGWVADERSNVHTDGLPHSLEHKLPGASREWRWRYVFPAKRTYVDSAGVRRRHHLHHSALQRAVTQGAHDAGLAKRVTCHACGIRLRPICSRVVRTFARCRNCWVIRMCGRR